MCVRTAGYYTLKEWMEYTKLSATLEIARQYVTHYNNNAYGHFPSQVVTTDGLALFNWGLIPSYIKTAADASQSQRSCVNARSETMFDLPSFKESLENGQRCLITVNGFFENRHLSDKQKTKQPYYITLKDQPIYSIAGIYSNWVGPDGVERNTFALVTCPANARMKYIHNGGDNPNRMPVILSRENEKTWLSLDLKRGDILELCQPFPQEKMNDWTVSRVVNNNKIDNNTSEIIKPYTPPPVAETGSLF
jgi:putative SOS response-associated peptidase YedK